MAIYYIDPHTTTNGTGTWASPWSLSTAHNTLVSGDEVRIKGVALTSLLTGTSYTATVTNKYQLTITAGGGLGADWAVGDTAYITEFDTFFKVTAKATNVISCGSSNYGMLPISNSATTSITLRKVNTTSYPVSTTSTTYYTTGSYTSLNNITISDCWTDATTRVTNGTVKTLFNTSSTSSIYFYFDSTSAGTFSNWTVNLQNTHIMAGAGDYNGIYLNLYSTNSTYNVNQLQQYYFSGGLTIGYGNSIPPASCNLTIKNWINGNFAYSLYGKSFTIAIQNLITSTPTFFTQSPQSLTNSNITIGTMVYGGSGNLHIFYVGNCSDLTMTLTTALDCWSEYSPSNAYIAYAVGPGSFTFGSSVILKYNRRASNITTINTGLNYTLVQDNVIIPDFTIPSGITVTTKYAGVNLTSTAASSSTLVPTVSRISYPTMPVTAQLPYGNTYGCNMLVTSRDSGQPVEILSLANTGLGSGNSATTFPIVSTDSVTYRTVAPSLKSNLTTRVSSFWANSPKAIKTIKIPVTSGTSYTVTGYIRTDDTSYVAGDCRMSIVLNNAELTGTNVSTGCINAWQQFTLTFTATQTCEAVLAWQMYYRNGAKSYWLDDLTIS